MSDNGKILSECPVCGAVAVQFRDIDRSFPFGEAADQIELHAHVPVGTCSACGLEFTDERAERLQHEEVCKHLGILNPAQIERRRKSWGMSRQRYAEVTKIGEASLSRWERGVGVQNGALDQLLYLLGYADNMRRLIEREAETRRGRATNGINARELLTRFPNIKDPSHAQREAGQFKLRSIAGV